MQKIRSIMTPAATQTFKLKDLDAALELSRRLASAFPQPETCITGIYELLINAIEHGNLGVGLEAKTDLLRRGKWRDEITRRISLPENVDKQVDIELTLDGQSCRLRIRDHGRGFAWKNYLSPPQPGRRPNGRGLWIAFHSNFDEVTFNTTGNEVTCVAKL